MKWIFITLAGGVLAFMAYSTYSSINLQLQSSAVSQNSTNAASKPQPTPEQVQKTIQNTRTPPTKPQAK